MNPYAAGHETFAPFQQTLNEIPHRGKLGLALALLGIPLAGGLGYHAAQQPAQHGFDPQLLNRLTSMISPENLGIAGGLGAAAGGLAGLGGGHPVRGAATGAAAALGGIGGAYGGKMLADHMQLQNPYAQLAVMGGAGLLGALGGGSLTNAVMG